MKPAARSAALDPGRLLAQATLRAAALLGLSGSALDRVLGLSEATVSRIGDGERAIPPAAKEGELAALLVRVYRSLDALVGNDERRRACSSYPTYDDALSGTPPGELLQTVQGLARIAVYLDSMRARS